MSGKKRPFAYLCLWAGSAALVVAAGIVLFPLEKPGTGFWESLYLTLRLFIFEHDLPQFPRTVGLRILYFAAPLIALSAVGTILRYVFRHSPSLRTRWMSGHIIVCGVGRTGKLLAESARKHGLSVAGIDLGPPETLEDWQADARIPVLYGSFLSQRLLDMASAKRARSIIFASGDDLANLEGVISAYEWMRTDQGPYKLLWAHIANEQLAARAREAMRTKGKVGIRLFDTYRIAAEKMMDCYLPAPERTELQEIIVLGFGKFGRDLVEILLSDARAEETWSLLVVDQRDRSRELESLARDKGEQRAVSFLKTPIQSYYPSEGAGKAFFLCTDDDVGNLTTAMLLAGRLKSMRIFVRMARWPLPATAEHFGEDSRMTFVNINDLVRQGIEALPGILAPAEQQDLRRVNNSKG